MIVPAPMTMVHAAAGKEHVLTGVDLRERGGAAEVAGGVLVGPADLVKVAIGGVGAVREQPIGAVALPSLVQRAAVDPALPVGRVRAADAPRRRTPGGGYFSSRHGHGQQEQQQASRHCRFPHAAPRKDGWNTKPLVCTAHAVI